MSVKILRIDGDREREVVAIDRPIRWDPVYERDTDTDEDYVIGWSMFIPQMVDGHEIGGISFDITVSMYGELTGMGKPMRFDSIYEAQAYAEATYRLKEATDGT